MAQPVSCLSVAGLFLSEVVASRIVSSSCSNAPILELASLIQRLINVAFTPQSYLCLHDEAIIQCFRMPFVY
ncbi:MAG: hypothetical protein ACI9Z7_000334 [Alteromonas macleodii]|jgi:hypothetical protein